MQEKTEETFLNRVVNFIAQQRGLNPQDAEVRANCQQLIGRARKAGFSAELEVATFAACGFAFGMDFDGSSNLPFREIMLDRDADNEAKAEMMAELLDSADEKNAGGKA